MAILPIIDFGARINLPDDGGFTALFHAIEVGKNDNVKILIEKGADLNHKNKAGINPLFFAQKKKQPRAEDLLLKAGAKEMPTHEIKSIERVKLLRNLLKAAAVIGFFWFVGNAIFSASIDISNEESVIKDMQGTWVGNDHEGGVYTHYKLEISGNNFRGWLTSEYTIDEPSWSDQPDETGTYSLSPVQGYTNSSGKYRNINFISSGGGFGDNSLTARAFTNMIIYDEAGGLYVVSWGRMNKK